MKSQFVTDLLHSVASVSQCFLIPNPRVRRGGRSFRQGQPRPPAHAGGGSEGGGERQPWEVTGGPDASPRVSEDARPPTRVPWLVPQTSRQQGGPGTPTIRSLQRGLEALHFGPRDRGESAVCGAFTVGAKTSFEQRWAGMCLREGPWSPGVLGRWRR